jgi:transcriptional regulator with XRE-family HTH domain
MGKKHDYETDPGTMGGRMWLRMQEKGVTPLELADEAGVTVTAVTHWLKGKAKNMKAENLFVVADYLGLEARWLTLKDGPKERANSRTVKHASVFRGSVRKEIPTVDGRKAKRRIAG